MQLQEKVPLSSHTTFKIGGEADFFCVIENKDDLVEAIKFAKKNKLDFKILGGGSNLLVSDEGVRGLVIKNNIKFFDFTEEGNSVYLTVGAGELLDEVIEKTVGKNWWGLENLSHIPGTVGATPIQNVGAYGVETKDVLESVLVYDPQEEEFKVLKKSDCKLSYRNSIFKEDHNELIVVSVTYKLSLKPKPVLEYKDLNDLAKKKNVTQQDIREKVIAVRSKKFPDWSVVGTAGSFFKNPVVTEKQFEKIKSNFRDIPYFDLPGNKIKLPLGYILDKICQLKGYREGAVGTYTEQSLVVVNYENAKASEVENFVESVAKKVKDKIGIDINWEVTKW